MVIWLTPLPPQLITWFMNNPIAASILYGDFRRTANVCDLRLVGIPFFHMSDTRSSFSSACCCSSALSVLLSRSDGTLDALRIIL